MANECLKTTLPATINNPSLEELGEIKIYSENESAIKVGITTYRPVILTYDDGTSATINAAWGTSNQVSLKKGTARIKDVYNISSLMFDITSGFSAQIKTSVLKYCYDLKGLSFPSAIKEVSFLVGDIAELNKCTELCVLGLRLHSNSLYGDIASISNCIKLYSLNLYMNTAIVGTLESLLSGMMKNGRTSGYLDVILGSSAITFNGDQHGTKYATFSESDIKVYSDSKMTNLIGTYSLADDAWTY